MGYGEKGRPLRYRKRVYGSIPPKVKRAVFLSRLTQAIVPDNLKSGVTCSNRYEPGINIMFDDFADHYQTVILPARVRRPQDKALVENAVNLVYQRIYAPLRNRIFYSLKELNEAMWDLLEQHNNTPFQRLKTSRRELFDNIEKQVLKPLPKERYAIKQCKELTVQFNYHVELREDRHYYSVPWQLKGKRVRVVYDDRNVAISEITRNQDGIIKVAEIIKPLFLK